MKKLNDFIQILTAACYYVLLFVVAFILMKGCYNSCDNYDVVMDMIKVFGIFFIIYLLLKKD